MTKKKKIQIVYACCSICLGIKPLSAIPSVKCSHLWCDDNTKYKSFWYRRGKRKYVNNAGVRYREVKGRMERTVLAYP